MQNDGSEAGTEIYNASWQVTLMSPDMHRAYSFPVLEFIWPDGRPYQTQQRAVPSEDGTIIYQEKKIQMTIKDHEDKVCCLL